MKHRSSNKGRSYTSNVIIYGAAFAALIGLLLLASAETPFGADAHEGTIATAQVVATRAAHHQDRYTLQHDFIGQVEAKQTSYLGFELSGVIDGLAVEEGDRVQGGDVLASLDTTRLTAQRDEVSARLARAVSDLALAESTYDRTFAAYEVNAVSAHEKDGAHQAKAALAAELETVKAQLERVRIDIHKSRLKAPFDGVIIAREIDEGTVVSSGQTVLTMQQEAGLNVRVGVTPGMLDQLRIGQTKTIHVGSRTLRARVQAIVPAVSRLRTVDVLFSLEEDLGTIRPGDMVRLPLERTVRKKGFWVPMQALREGRRGLWSLYVVEPLETEYRKTGPSEATHRVSRRNVVVLNHQGDMAYVNGSVNENERFATLGAHKLVPGQPIRLAPDNGGSK